MATISITISDSQMTVLKNALADLDSDLSSSDIDDAYIKQRIIDFLKIVIITIMESPCCC